MSKFVNREPWDEELFPDVACALSVCTEAGELDSIWVKDAGSLSPCSTFCYSFLLSPLQGVTLLILWETH